MNKLKFPVYKLRIKEDDQSNLSVDFIALVDEPAIQSNWLTFDEKKIFSVDKERKMVMGAFMIANMPIYRRDEKFGEHYVVFDKEEVFKIVQKFFRKGNTSNFNIMHDPSRKLDGVYLIESFIVDKTRGVSAPVAFEGISEGSWIGTVKIDNEEVWNDFIKTQQLKGFSIEGFFDQVYYNEQDLAVIEEITKIVNS